MKLKNLLNVNLVAGSILAHRFLILNCDAVFSKLSAIQFELVTTRQIMIFVYKILIKYVYIVLFVKMFNFFVLRWRV
jgi:hypothetical protein